MICNSHNVTAIYGINMSKLIYIKEIVDYSLSPDSNCLCAFSEITFAKRSLNSTLRLTRSTACNKAQ